MTAKLNQIIAIEKGIKSRAYAAVSETHKIVQKSTLFNGFSKTYSKKADDGEEFPSEKARVQYTTKDVLRDMQRNTAELVDVTARKDWTNTVALADVVVDDKIIVANAPVSFLLFLEKQLTDIRTFVDCLPVLDETDTWTLDSNSGLYKTDVVQTHRTKKVQKPIVMYDATPEHPAQTQLITEDVVVGYWNQVKQSGAMPKTEKQALAARVEKLLIAVKQAREEANMTDENTLGDVGNVSKNIFEFILEE